MVVEDTVTLSVPVKVCVPGENVGAAACGGAVKVYVALLTEEFANPEATAIALIVVVDVTDIAPVYRVEPVVGVHPVVVQ